MNRLVGLRGRLTVALLGVSALALAIAAFALLVPLDALLRHDALTSLGQEAKTAQARFDALPAGAFRRGSPRLTRAVHNLSRRVSADVTVVGQRGRVLAASDPDSRESFRQAVRAIRVRHLVKGTVTGPEGHEAQVAVPLAVGGRRYGLGLRKSLSDVGAARNVVERALLVAALIALVGALVAGAAIAGRLVRRLAALRDTSLRLAELGPVAEVQDDGARDEIGDLTRAFAMMQHRLRRQEQARRTFVSTASHELRTPLASLRLMLHSATEELDNPDPDLRDTREQLALAVDQTERLSKLAAELLDLSRLDAGAPLRAERVELAELARSVIAEFDPRTAATGATLQLRAPQPRWATGDPGSVAQILRILLDNALQHGPPGTPIEVDVGGATDEPAITVTDAGPGVPPQDRDRIFERFERGSNPAGTSGFGLGLAIGRELAQRMGGDLWLAPGWPGACFRLSLPPAVAVEEGTLLHA